MRSVGSIRDPVEAFMAVISFSKRSGCWHGARLGCNLAAHEAGHLKSCMTVMCIRVAPGAARAVKHPQPLDPSPTIQVTRGSQTCHEQARYEQRHDRQASAGGAELLLGSELDR